MITDVISHSFAYTLMEVLSAVTKLTETMISHCRYLIMTLLSLAYALIIRLYRLKEITQFLSSWYRLSKSHMIGLTKNIVAQLGQVQHFVRASHSTAALTY